MRLGSCVAVSAAILPETIEALAGSTAAAPGKGTPVLITRGDADSVLPAEEAAASVRALTAAGKVCAYYGICCLTETLVVVSL